MKILAVEDDPNLQKLLLVHLEREKWSVTVSESAEKALQILKQDEFDVVLVDWMLAGSMNGLDLCKRISGQSRVIMLTSRSNATDVVAALESGADDFVAKPFDAAILIARIRAVLRRAQSAPSNKLLKLGNVELNREHFEAKCNGQPMDLTPSEFGILATMLENPGCVLSRQKLLQQIQARGVNVVERTIDTHVYTLRKKMGACASIIETIRGVGYRIHGD